MADLDPYPLARRTIALVLAGGRGSRLHALTAHRAKPAVYFGGKFRIIDFALSNCLNSGVRRISVLTQYKSHSLLRHLQRGWSLLRSEFNEYLDLLPAQQQIDDHSWYQGTADAVFQNIRILYEQNPLYVLVLAGDHVYKMDYAKLIADHADHAADGVRCTVACVEVPLAEARALGVMATDAQRRIVRFDEKPDAPEPMPDRPDHALASMGVYVFDADYLFDALQVDSQRPDSSRDFGKDIIPVIVARGEALAHPFGLSCVKSAPDAPSYWRDVGTIDAYWAANLDLIRPLPELDMYDRQWPIWTYQEQLAPAKFVFDDDGRRGMAVDSLVSGGCIVSGAVLRRSVLFSNVRVHSYSTVEDSVLLPGAQIGRSCRIRKAVIDTGCQIPPNWVIGFDAAADARRFFRSEQGVVHVTRSMVDNELSVLASGAKN